MKQKCVTFIFHFIPGQYYVEFLLPKPAAGWKTQIPRKKKIKVTLPLPAGVE